MIRKIRITLSNGSVHVLHTPPGVDITRIFQAMILGEEIQETGLHGEWLETVMGDWVKRDQIAVLSLRSEDQFALDEIMALSREEQEDFFTRNPLPDLHSHEMPAGDE